MQVAPEEADAAAAAAGEAPAAEAAEDAAAPILPHEALLDAAADAADAAADAAGHHPGPVSKAVAGRGNKSADGGYECLRGS